MKATIGKQIGDIKVASIKNDIVRYSKRYWQGDWKRTIFLTMHIDAFSVIYPQNM